MKDATKLAKDALKLKFNVHNVLNAKGTCVCKIHVDATRYHPLLLQSLFTPQDHIIWCIIGRAMTNIGWILVVLNVFISVFHVWLQLCHVHLFNWIGLGQCLLLRTLIKNKRNKSNKEGRKNKTNQWSKMSSRMSSRSLVMNWKSQQPRLTCWIDQKCFRHIWYRRLDVERSEWHSVQFRSKFCWRLQQQGILDVC